MWLHLERKSIANYLFIRRVGSLTFPEHHKFFLSKPSGVCLYWPSAIQTTTPLSLTFIDFHDKLPDKATYLCTVSLLLSSLDASVFLALRVLLLKQSLGNGERIGYGTDRNCVYRKSLTGKRNALLLITTITNFICSVNIHLWHFILFLFILSFGKL